MYTFSSQTGSVLTAVTAATRHANGTESMNCRSKSAPRSAGEESATMQQM